MAGVYDDNLRNLPVDKIVNLIEANHGPTLFYLYRTAFSKVKKSVFKNRSFSNRKKTSFQEAFYELWKLIKQKSIRFDAYSDMEEFLLEETRTVWTRKKQLKKQKRTIFINRGPGIEASENKEKEKNLEEINRIRKALDQPETRCREIFRIFFFKKKSGSETARILRLQENEMMEEKFHCLLMLRKIFRKPAAEEYSSLDFQTAQAIDDYIGNHFSPQEQEAFKNNLIFNAHLKKQIANQRIWAETLEAVFLWEEMDSFHSRLLAHLEKRNRIFRIVFLIALTVLLIGPSIRKLVLQQQSSVRVYETNFRPPLPVKSPEIIFPEFSQGMDAYREKSYRKAIRIWEPLYADSPAEDTLVFYLGTAHLAAGNSKQAAYYLNQLLQIPGNNFEEETGYYLALIYLKENNPEQAKEVLKSDLYVSHKNLFKQIRNLP